MHRFIRNQAQLYSKTSRDEAIERAALIANSEPSPDKVIDRTEGVACSGVSLMLMDGLHALALLMWQERYRGTVISSKLI